MPLHSQQDVEREARAWASVWQADAQPPTPLWPTIMGESLPELCVTAAMYACAAFPSDTGLGWDNLHPRALRRVSVAAVATLLRIFVVAEILGWWPEMIGIVVIALLPKAGGGNRPIGLCKSLIRLWMRMRLPVAQAWQSANDRPYLFAGEASQHGSKRQELRLGHTTALITHWPCWILSRLSMVYLGIGWTSMQLPEVITYGLCDCRLPCTH